MGQRERAGELVRLRALLKDDIGDPAATASGVYVHIFEPDADSTDLTEAYLVSGIATNLGNGIFEYEFQSPSCGPGGLWNDVWEAQLSCQGIAGTFGFTLSASGIATSLDCQLFCNNLVQVNLASGLRSTDGSFLEEEFNLEFMTTTTPSYTSVQQVRLQIGAFVNDIPDSIIQMSILDASLEAECITFAPTLTNSKLYQHALRQYTTCKAGGMLLTNVGNLLLRSKTLADLSVTYDTNGVRDAMESLMDCMAKWEPQIISGGGSRASTQPQMVVRGELDPDRPTVSRDWQQTDLDHHSMVPAANTTTDDPTKRRQKKTYKSRFSRKGTKYW